MGRSAQHGNKHAMDATKKDTLRQLVGLDQGMYQIQDQLELAVSLSEKLLWQNESTPDLPAEVDHPEAEGAWVHPGAAEMVECSR